MHLDTRQKIEQYSAKYSWYSFRNTFIFLIFNLYKSVKFRLILNDAHENTNFYSD